MLLYILNTVTGSDNVLDTLLKLIFQIHLS